MAEKHREQQQASAKAAHQKRKQARQTNSKMLKSKPKRGGLSPSPRRKKEVHRSSPHMRAVQRHAEDAGGDLWETDQRLPGIGPGSKNSRAVEPSPYLQKHAPRKVIKAKSSASLPKILHRDTHVQPGAEEADSEVQQLIHQREKIRSKYMQAEMKLKKRAIEHKRKQEMQAITSKLQGEIEGWKEKIAILENSPVPSESSPTSQPRSPSERIKELIPDTSRSNRSKQGAQQNTSSSNPADPSLDKILQRLSEQRDMITQASKHDVNLASPSGAAQSPTFTSMMEKSKLLGEAAFVDLNPNVGRAKAKASS